MATNETTNGSQEELSVKMLGPDSISTTTSELLLQKLLNAIRTTNDIIGECNNNQQSATVSSSLSTESKSLLSSNIDVVMRRGKGGIVPPPPPGNFSDGDLTRWQLESKPVTEEDFSSDFLIPPPLEYDFGVIADDPVLLHDEGMVFPPPPVFDVQEKSISDCKTETVLKKVSMGLPVLPSIKNLPNIRQFDSKQRVEKESGGKIVGGLFSVRQVCTLFENDQMKVLRDAVDMEETERTPEKPDRSPESLYLSSGTSTNQSIGKVTEVGKSGNQGKGAAVTMTTFKGPENRCNGFSDEKERMDPKIVQNSEIESASCVPNNIEKTSSGKKSLGSDVKATDDVKTQGNVIESAVSKSQSEAEKLKALKGENGNCSVISTDPDKKSPDLANKWPDADKKSPNPSAAAESLGGAGAVLPEVDPKMVLTEAAAGGTIPATTVEYIRPGGGVGGLVPAEPGAVDLACDRNLKPVIVDAASVSAEADGSSENADVLTNCIERNLKSDSETFTSFGKQEKNEETGRRKVPSIEKRKMEVVQVNVTKSIEQKEKERHFISKTVTKTMTQETRTTAVGTVTEGDARPMVSSMYAAESTATLENFEDANCVRKEDSRDKSENNNKETTNKRENFGLEDKKECIGKGKEDSGEMTRKERSVFDSLLDETKERRAERKCFSAFEQQEATRIKTETKSCDGTSATRNIEIKHFPSVDNSGKTGNRGNSSSDRSTVPVNPVTERKEEILRLPRPTSLMVPPAKLLHNSSVGNSPVTGSTPNGQNETSVSSSRFAAPLATPEESLADTPHAHRSRHSSVGPSRSRQSSVGPCPSRQSSVGSLLGFQLMQTSTVSTHFVVVAIDFGTTYSGYAFSFTRDPDSIHMMRRWEGGDPGIVNQKTPTTLLLTPDGKFHSFGFTARDFYHDLDAQEAKKWLYFEKFKMTLHHNADLNKETTIRAANGKAFPALTVFSNALRFFKDHALQELSDQSSTTILNEDIRWVLTVPAIWRSPAKQFMRQAAYQAGIASPDNPNQLLIALEPEAASIYVRKLRLYQLMPDPVINQLLKREPTPDPLDRGRSPDTDEYASPNSVKYKTLPSSPSYRHSICPTSTTASVGEEVDIEGTNYMVVDCGGGTVDITVYEMEAGCGQLKELHKATGGPFGSLEIDMEFEKVLIGIFGSDFIEAFRTKRPAGWVDLMIAFESRKRTASPIKNNPLNVALPFSFIDYYKKYKGSQVETAIRKYGNKEISWSSQGMLRLTTTAMRRLFQPTIDHIKQAVGDVLNDPNARDVKYLFLVGGFAESAILQMQMRKEFDHILKILIPQDVGLTILKGAVCFGLDPTVVGVRRCRMTYGVGVLNRFIPDKHPRSKMITKDGAQWCTDVFDKFVEIDQSVAIGETVVRSYTPAKAGQKSTIIHVYCTEKPNPVYMTDPGVKRCGTLCLDLTDIQYRHSQKPRRREIQARMTFGDTEIKVTALDIATGKYVRAAIDFMNK